MIDRYGLSPAIVTPVRLRVSRAYTGGVGVREITAFAEAGRIGKDETTSCGFPNSRRLSIRNSGTILEVGKVYVVLLDHELGSNRKTGEIQEPMIEDMFVVYGDAVIGLSGKAEPLP
jgi:hypothetical protein